MTAICYVAKTMNKTHFLPLSNSSPTKKLHKSKYVITMDCEKSVNRDLYIVL